MTTHRITYDGPSSLAVQTATELADAEGVELTSSNRPGGGAQQPGEVRLVLTVEGPTEAVEAAVMRIQQALPPSATITVHGAPT